MSKITQHIQSFLKNHTSVDLTIAYSGGVDSQVLLHALAILKQNQSLPNVIRVCHINHGLSDNAKAWEVFARQQSDKYGFNSHLISVDLDKSSTQSLEEQAREARYKALISVTNESQMILTGHHLDDQAETFLLALKRGAGLKGLSAMQACSLRQNRLIGRPLLEVSRQEIIDYAKENNLDWVEDESNIDNRFDRNFLRNNILPSLKDRWPHISRTISRSAKHLSDAQQLIDEVAAQDYEKCRSINNKVNQPVSLNISLLMELSVIRFNYLIRYFLSTNNCLMPTQKQLSILRLQLASEQDKNPAMKIGEHWLRRFGNQLFVTDNFNDVSDWLSEFKLASLVEKKKVIVILPDGLGSLLFSIDQQSENDAHGISFFVKNTAESINVSFKHSNPNCHPDYRERSRSLKKVLQELSIPTWMRNRIPFIRVDNELAVVAEQFVCRPYTKEKQIAPHIQIRVMWQQ